MGVQPFKIAIPQESLDDLQERLAKVRWPEMPGGDTWERGTAEGDIQTLVSHWRNEFDWRKQESALNEFSHYRCEIDGVSIHFIHERGKGPNPLPLILTHGWPDSFLRYQKVIPRLTDPARFGGDPADAFDVVVPSLPGFAFSGSHKVSGINNARVAELWLRLMRDELKYCVFGAAGGDIGSGVSRYLAATHPEHVVGIHLTDLGIVRELLAPSAELSGAQQAYRQTANQWIAQEGAYMALQATKPRTLAYALTDSPVGLASWILEKYRAWSDCNGDVFSRYTADELLTHVCVYWFTGTAGSAANLYFENTHGLPPVTPIRVPIGIAQFPADILPPPRDWAETHFDIRRWSELPTGGHFGAFEDPAAFVHDLCVFFAPLRKGINLTLPLNRNHS